jgi:hypothetical protein
VTTVGIQQPTYLPWLGYFEQIARADVFVILDTVQFEKRSWQNRNRLKTTAGEVFWLTVPVSDLPLETPIKDITVAQNNPWRKKHLGSIRASLGAAPHFKTHFPAIEAWLNTETDRLAQVNVGGIKAMMEILGIKTRLVWASEMDLDGKRSDLVLAICKALGADAYYSAAGSSSYLNTQIFADAGISVAFQEWPHPTYSQDGGAFVSHLAAVDALMHVGADTVRSYLKL